MAVLVTGGAGYIGSHTVYHLIEAGFQVVVLDNLQTGFSWAIHPQSTFVQGNMGDRDLVAQIIRQHKIDTVIHFAAHVSVPESVSNPLKYYQNNVVNSFNLIQTCYGEKVRQFIFSSTAATYGEPHKRLVTETDPAQPMSPYGMGKLMVEQMLKDLSYADQINNESHPFRAVILRYFNAAGARPDGKIGQATANAIHLIKVACECALKIRSKMFLFGEDYETHDGTCIRDYVHVEDLASAHVLALQYLNKGGMTDLFNCGYGKGYSVKEVIAMIKQISGVDFAVEVTGRRAGDPVEVVADSTKIKTVLGWKPQFENLENICRTTFEWEKKYRTEHL